MKKIFFIIALLLRAPHFTFAQEPDNKVVFDTSTRDSISKQAVVREVALITKENPVAIYEIISKHHEGWGFIMVAH